MKPIRLSLLILLLTACSAAPEPVAELSLQQAAPLSTATQAVAQDQPTTYSQMTQSFSGDQCEARDEVQFTAAPADPAQLAYIYPMGYMFGSHVTPVDHQYYYWLDYGAPLDEYPVYSPADGVVVSVGYLQSDYRVIIEHSCDLYSIYIHLETLVGPLAELQGQVGFEQGWSGRILVAAGEVIAYDGGTTGLDYSLHDARVTLPGFIKPESYTAEAWKIHTVDPYGYFDEPARSQLLAVNLRQVAPLGGKIDHDLPDTPLGNWFVEGTNGYQGVVSSEGPVAPNQHVGYWNTHLAIAPDAIDPGVIMVLHGIVSNNGAPFAISAESPDPAEITVDSGPVKLELVSWYYQGSDGGQWFGNPAAMDTGISVYRFEDQVFGVLLLQMLDEGHLKAEFFIGSAPEEVAGFTDAAQVFER